MLEIIDLLLLGSLDDQTQSVGYVLLLHPAVELLVALVIVLLEVLGNGLAARRVF